LPLSLGSISSTFYAKNFCIKVLCAAFPYLQSQNVTRKKLRKHFCTKNLRVNVDEIDYWAAKKSMFFPLKNIAFPWKKFY